MLYNDGLELTGELDGDRAELELAGAKLQRGAKDDSLLGKGGAEEVGPGGGFEEEVALLVGEGTEGGVLSLGRTQTDEGIDDRGLVRLADERPLEPSLGSLLGSEDSPAHEGEEEGE